MMLFSTKGLSFNRIFVFLLLCFFLNCFGSIEKEKFTFLKTISQNEENNVYQTFFVANKRNHLLTCSAECVTQRVCIGIDVCDGRICRLWNATIYQNSSINNSNNFCKRYVKVYTIIQVQFYVGFDNLHFLTYKCFINVLLFSLFQNTFYTFIYKKYLHKH